MEFGSRQLKLIAKRGRMGWQRASGNKWRALVGACISRYKRVIGDGLHSRTEDGRRYHLAGPWQKRERRARIGIFLSMASVPALAGIGGTDARG